MAYREGNSRPFPVDAYNHFRITHPDRDLRPIIKRIHRLATPSASASGSSGNAPTEGHDASATGQGTAAPSTEEGDEEQERELVKLDLQRWKATIERIMGSVGNLEQQKGSFEEDVRKTRARIDSAKATLTEDKAVLSKKRKERDEMVECDKVTKKIKARGKTRAQLEEQISTLKESIEQHKATHELYVSTAQDRAQRFKDIIALVAEVKDIKLPDTTVSDDNDRDIDAMDVDQPGGGEGGAATNARLNASALTFQPVKSTGSARPSSSNHADGTSSQPLTRASTPAPSAPSNAANTGTGAGRHGLPARPARAASSKGPLSSTNTAPQGRPNSSGHSVPSRPSNLRTVTGGPRGGGSGGSLEEGEVGGDEEGEVNERRGASKRGGEERSTRSTRNQR